MLRAIQVAVVGVVVLVTVVAAVRVRDPLFSATLVIAATLVTLPVIVVAYGAASGSLFSSTTSVWILGAVAWAVAAAGLVRGTKAVQRERLVG